MGFAAQLTEILHGLPTNRQTLLFSATLPKSGQLCGETHFEQSVGFIEDNILDAGEIHVHFNLQVDIGASHWW
jgi:hypothetical protein